MDEIKNDMMPEESTTQDEVTNIEQSAQDQPLGEGADVQADEQAGDGADTQDGSQAEEGADVQEDAQAEEDADNQADGDAITEKKKKGSLLWSIIRILISIVVIAVGVFIILYLVARYAKYDSISSMLQSMWIELGLMWQRIIY